jgi:hypothetical protein
MPGEVNNVMTLLQECKVVRETCSLTFLFGVYAASEGLIAI